MNKSEEAIKESVREIYGEIAQKANPTEAGACCGSGGCSPSGEALMMHGESYESLPGYHPDADLGLGCGIPTQYSKIKKGDTVIDLGSGAGNDVFVARQQVGEQGLVIGVDMTAKMIERARSNNTKLGHKNVEFRLGEIENLPVDSNTADVVISNCVLNLVPNKTKAFSEIFRSLKPGGQFTISDIVIQGELPSPIRDAVEMYAGCVSGALQKREYLGLIVESGFQEISILKEKRIPIPDDLIAQYLSKEEIAEFNLKGVSVMSLTISAKKPEEASSCCGGPAPEGKDACCVLDAEAKDSGKEGCGCN